eukprot:9370784-Lingulodinium_polyedra.AAC.1
MPRRAATAWRTPRSARPRSRSGPAGFATAATPPSWTARASQRRRSAIARCNEPCSRSATTA